MEHFKTSKYNTVFLVFLFFLKPICCWILMVYFLPTSPCTHSRSLYSSWLNCWFLSRHGRTRLVFNRRACNSCRYHWYFRFVSLLYLCSLGYLWSFLFRDQLVCIDFKYNLYSKKYVPLQYSNNSKGYQWFFQTDVIFCS